MDNTYPNHLEITGTPDIGAVLSVLERQGNRDEILRLASNRMGTMMTEASAADSLAGLIERFRRMRQQHTTGSFVQVMSTTASNDVKPKGRARRSIHETDSPILIRGMHLGSTHRNKYLCGRIAVDDPYFCIASTVFLLEDVSGDLVEVAVYNSPNACTSLVSQLFPKRKAVSLVEPYYKVRQDMTKGVRVENPGELVAWQFPRTCLDWKDIGNQFMLSKAPAPALRVFVMMQPCRVLTRRSWKE